MAKYTREQIVAAAIKAAAKADGRLPMKEFCRRFGIGKSQLRRLFPEGWQEVRRLAGITEPSSKGMFSDDQLLEKFHGLAAELGTIPSWNRFVCSGVVCDRTMRKRFGSPQAHLERYRIWLETNHPQSPLLGALLSALRGRRKGPSFGPPTNLCGLRYAPTNEQGVIFLFGMLSAHLGIAVEGIQSAYPDCQAKRCVDRRSNRWEPVRIEFEFASSNFRDHCHDPAGCDLIVCWQDDWPECPLDVIELRAVVEQLSCSPKTAVSCCCHALAS